MAGDLAKISVLLEVEEAERYDAYCKLKGFKKSSLAARLIREHMDLQQFRCEKGLFDKARQDTQDHLG